MVNLAACVERDPRGWLVRIWSAGLPTSDYQFGNLRLRASSWLGCPRVADVSGLTTWRPCIGLALTRRTLPRPSSSQEDGVKVWRIDSDYVQS